MREQEHGNIDYHYLQFLSHMYVYIYECMCMNSNHEKYLLQKISRLEIPKHSCHLTLKYIQLGLIKPLGALFPRKPPTSFKNT